MTGKTSSAVWMIGLCLWVGLVSYLASSVAGDQEPAVVPDASQAQIDGEVAIGGWAAVDGQILGPNGFTVHLADDASLEEELVFPAGTWFQPPPGRYKSWIEGETEGEPVQAWIAPGFDLLRYSGGPFRGRGIAATTEVVPAGRVQLDPAVELSPVHSLRLLHLDATSEQGQLHRGFLRAVTAEAATEAVLLPEGQAIGLIYDRRKGSYLKASRPVEVRRGRVARVRPAAARGVADLLVILQRPVPIDSAEEDDLELSLRTAPASGGVEAVRPPDVLVPTWEWVYALWYDVDGRSARLQVRSEQVFLEPQEVALRPGGVATFRGALRMLPALDARLELPPGLNPEAAFLELVRSDDGRRVAGRELPLDGTGVTRIEGLPATELMASLTLDGNPIWKLRQRLDLGAGEDRELVFRPEAILLDGTVYLGDEPAQGTVRLATLNERDMDRDRIWVETETGEQGDYEMALFAPGCYLLFVRLPDRPGPQHRVHGLQCIRDDTTLDLHVPRSTGRVRVVEAATGEPLAGAAVTYDYTFDKPGDGIDARPAGGSGTVTTGDDGWAQLPPLHPGELTAWAEKKGYRRSREPVASEVHADETATLVLRLEAIGEGSELVLTLADGRPAADAEVRAQVAAWNELPLWEGRADEAGRIRVPNLARGAWLLVRHPEAGGWLQGWDPADDPAVSWVLPAPAGDLRLRTEGLDGEPRAGAALALRYPHGWVAGRSLAWLTGTAVAGSDGRGVWASSRLPAADMAVLAGSNETIRLALQGLLDGSAQRLSPPWPAEPIPVTAAGR